MNTEQGAHKVGWIVSSEDETTINVSSYDYDACTDLWNFKIQFERAEFVVSEIAQYVMELSSEFVELGISCSYSDDDSSVEFYTTYSSERELVAQWYSLCRLFGILMISPDYKNPFPEHGEYGWPIPEPEEQVVSE